MQLQSKNLNKVRALLYNICKYFFNEYFEFGSVSPFWIWRENICVWVDLIQSGSIGSRFLQKHVKNTYNSDLIDILKVSINYYENNWIPIRVIMDYYENNW